MSAFDQQVNAFVRKVKARYRATGREAVQETISQAQVTKPQGGRMPIITGFLRASVQAAIGITPRGPSGNPGKIDFSSVNQAAGEPVQTVLLRWDPWRPRALVVGWTANYARDREAKEGYLRGALENWDINVMKAAKKAEAIK